MEDIWRIRSVDDRISVELSSDAKNGTRSLRIEYPEGEPGGYQDWSLENRVRLVDVEPGEVWTASAWVRYEDTERVGLEVVILLKGSPVPHWTSGYGAAFGSGDWELLQATAVIPPGCDQILVRVSGAGKTLAWVDDVRLWRGEARAGRPSKAEVRGWAFNGKRVEENLDRGVVAMPVEEGVVNIGWRLLSSDPPDIAFNVYRATAGGEPKLLSKRPISATTDFRDESARLDVEAAYSVRPVTGGREGAPSECFTVPAGAAVKPYLAIKLARPDITVQRVGIGDLNGDGRHDFVVLTPDANVDPYHNYWRPSETTFKLEAYLSDGTFLWRKDLGWSIEAGVWYSPYVVFDFDGDGRAEVAVKVGPDEDLRGKMPAQHGLYGPGRVTDGPEYVTILDGMTGREKARGDWPSRRGLGSYNHYSRNLMAVAYLDGKTPCLVLARGTYTVNKLEAWQFHDSRLEKLWTWDSTEEPGGRFYGQGGHTMHAADVTGDGRDEIVLGAAVIESNGQGLWSVNLGHPDNVWIGDIDPTRPGLEIYLGVEGARVKGSVQNGVCLLDARTGEILWGLKQRTYHVHGRGLVSNIDPRHAGMEVYSGEQAHPARWLHTARGDLIADERTFDMGLSPAAVYWDGTPERELLVENRLFKFPDELIADHVEGRQVAWLDLFGDWREEIVTAVPGELRIYVTPIAATDRRVTFLQDRHYRNGVAHLSMGYHRPPLPGGQPLVQQ